MSPLFVTFSSRPAPAAPTCGEAEKCALPLLLLLLPAAAAAAADDDHCRGQHQHVMYSTSALCLREEWIGDAIPPEPWKQCSQKAHSRAMLLPTALPAVLFEWEVGQSLDEKVERERAHENALRGSHGRAFFRKKSPEDFTCRVTLRNESVHLTRDEKDICKPRAYTYSRHINTCAPASSAENSMAEPSFAAVERRFMGYGEGHIRSLSPDPLRPPSAGVGSCTPMGWARGGGLNDRPSTSAAVSILGCIEGKREWKMRRGPHRFNTTERRQHYGHALRQLCTSRMERRLHDAVKRERERSFRDASECCFGISDFEHRLCELSTKKRWGQAV
jgi:hypothetical protein